MNYGTLWLAAAEADASAGNRMGGTFAATATPLAAILIRRRRIIFIVNPAILRQETAKDFANQISRAIQEDRYLVLTAHNLAGT